jgi:hypothetical protein
LCLLVGFAFPWLKFGAAEYRGYELVFPPASDIIVLSAIGNARWILLFVPVLGIALTAVGFLGFRWSGVVGLGISVLIIGYGVFAVVYLFFQVTGYGLWIVLAGALIGLIVGIANVMRSRRAKAEEPVESSEDPPPRKTRSSEDSAEAA